MFALKSTENKILSTQGKMGWLICLPSILNFELMSINALCEYTIKNLKYKCKSRSSLVLISYLDIL